MSRIFHSSRPDAWTLPRPHQDASARAMKHGKIHPMEPERKSLLSRLLGRII